MKLYNNVEKAKAYLKLRSWDTFNDMVDAPDPPVFKSRDELRILLDCIIKEAVKSGSDELHPSFQLKSHKS